MIDGERTSDGVIPMVCMMTNADELIAAARILSEQVSGLRFGRPVSHVYNPLEYARIPHEEYLRRYGQGRKQAVFLGMNPGPFGMVQTGIPFGDVAMARDWLKISAQVEKPACEHPRRPVEGFGCRRSEVSGQRLWSTIAAQFRTPERFFRKFFVANYCPLAFMEKSGRNLTPDKLTGPVPEQLFAFCDRHLERVARILQPHWVIGIGRFAAKRAEKALAGTGFRIGWILHPSPANPMANRNWAETVSAELIGLGVCGHGGAGPA